MTDKNKLQIALESRKVKGLPVVNLIESNFHSCGLIPNPAIFLKAFPEFISTRHYQPDPHGLLEAREAVARFYTEGGPVSRSDLHTNPEQIFLTASSSEAYSLLLGAFCEAGDNVLIPQPAYPLFEDLISYAGLEPRYYPLDEDNRWNPDTDLIELLIDDRTRFLIVISPNNPCGSVISTTVLDRITRICGEREVMIISDEVFSEFLMPPEKSLSPTITSQMGSSSQMPDTIQTSLYSRVEFPRAAQFAVHTPVFTINGISKMFASPDFKLSWIAVHTPESGNLSFADIAEAIENRNDTYLNATSYSQFLLPRLFAEATGFVRFMRTRIQNHKSFLSTQIPLLGQSGIRLNLPEGGIHFILSLPTNLDDETIALRLLDECGIYVHPGYLYGFDDDQPSLVLSLLGKTETWIPAFGKFANFLSLL